MFSNLIIPIFILSSLLGSVTALPKQPRELTKKYLGAYWPSYTDQYVFQVPWASMNIAYYYMAASVPTGLAILPTSSESELIAFVSNATANNVTPFVTIAGGDHSTDFHTFCSTTDGQNNIATITSNFVQKYKFAGVGINYEFPWGSVDERNYLACVKAIKAALPKSVLLSIDLAPFGVTSDMGITDMTEYMQYADFATMMNYNFAGPGSTGINAPLNSCSTRNSIKAVTEKYVAAGVPKSKQVIVIPAYGQHYTLASDKLVTTNGADGKPTQAYQPSTAGPNFQGYKYTEMILAGILDQTGMIGANGYTRYWDDCTQTPFLFNPSTKSFITYDDPQSFQAKANFVASDGLMGVIFFESSGATQEMYSALNLGLQGKPWDSASLTQEVATIYASCGGKSCPNTKGTPMCMGGGLTATCGYSNCNTGLSLNPAVMQCVDLKSDVFNCGRIGNQCPTTAGPASCLAGVCGVLPKPASSSAILTSSSLISSPSVSLAASVTKVSGTAASISAMSSPAILVASSGPVSSPSSSGTVAPGSIGGSVQLASSSSSKGAESMVLSASVSKSVETSTLSSPVSQRTSASLPSAVSSNSAGAATSVSASLKDSTSLDSLANGGASSAQPMASSMTSITRQPDQTGDLPDSASSIRAQSNLSSVTLTGTGAVQQVTNTQSADQGSSNGSPEVQSAVVSQTSAITSARSSSGQLATQTDSIQSFTSQSVAPSYVPSSEASSLPGSSGLAVLAIVCWLV